MNGFFSLCLLILAYKLSFTDSMGDQMKSKKILLIVLSVLLLAAAAYSLVLSNQLKRAKKEITTISINPLVLKEKLAKQPPEWMIEQIDRDLRPYASGITLKMLNEAFLGDKIRKFSLVRFKITDGHLTFSHDERHLYSRHFRELLACIQKLNEHAKLPDVDFIISLEDGFDANPALGPCFVFAKRNDLDSLILVPDIKAMTGYSRLRNVIKEANQKMLWKDKEEKAFWRGSATGGHFTYENWDRFARAKLVLLSLKYPEVIDARFHSILQAVDGLRDFMKAKGLVSSSVKKEDHLKYKFLIDVDGNSCSYERYFWLLASNSLVLKQMTPNIQWYYGALTPYEHYLPVQEDLSDLLEKIQWAKEHDAESQAIAENATQFTENHLSSEDTLVYLYHLLIKYAACLRD